MEKYPYPGSLDKYSEPQRAAEYFREMRHSEPKLEISRAKNFELSQAIELAGGPVVELAGPTADGYFPLKEQGLPESPIMTNVTPEAASGGGDWSPTQLARQHIDAQVDVRNVPFRAESVGVFLMSALTMTDEAHFLDEDYFQEALREYADYQPGQTNGRKNLRIRAMEEISQALRPDGLVILQYAVGQDLVVAQKLGLEVCETALREDEDEAKWQTTLDGPVFEYAILRKPPVNSR